PAPAMTGAPVPKFSPACALPDGVDVSTAGRLPRWDKLLCCRTRACALVAAGGEQCHRERGQRLCRPHTHALALADRGELRAVENVAERGPRAILARQLDQRVAPHRLAERESRALAEQPAVQARRDHDQRLLAQPAREGAQLLRPHPAHAQPPVAAVAKELGMSPPQLEALPGEQEL